MQAYSCRAREHNPNALPDVEVFERTEAENAADGWKDGDGDTMPGGWYWWTCFPGCLPDSDPIGPFDSEEEALADAQGDCACRACVMLDGIEHNLAGLTYLAAGIATKSCAECANRFGERDADAGEPDDEGAFSWGACDSCGSTLGGDRHVAHAENKAGEIVHLDVCTDCLLYLENGNLPEED